MNRYSRHCSLLTATTYKAPVTPGLRPGYDLPATENAPIVERTYDWSQRSWVIARAKSVAERSWSCSKPSHTGLTPRSRHTCDRKLLQSWTNRRTNVRLVAEAVRLVALVVGDRKWQISRNKVDGRAVQNLKPATPNRKRSHDQSCNWSCHLTTSGTTNRLLTDTITNVEMFLGFMSLPIRRPTLLTVRSIVGGHD